MTDTPEASRQVKLKTGQTVEVPPQHILRIIDGLFGFAGLENYALIPYDAESPFLWLQSLDEGHLAFLTLDPRLFAPDYRPVVLPDDLAAVGLDRLESGIVLVIVVIPDDPKQMTANMMGPVIVNPATRLAKQVISQSPQHKIRHHILGEGSESAAGA